MTTSFRVGKGIGIAYDSTLALFEPLNGALAESLWALVAAGAGIDELLEELSSTGLRSLGSFAMAQFEDTQTRLVVRGTARAVVESAAGRREVDAHGVRTWVEEVVEGVDSVELTLADLATAALPFRVERGLLPADLLRQGAEVAPALQGVALEWVDDFTPADVLTIEAEPAPVAPAEPVAVAPIAAEAPVAPVLDPARTITASDFGDLSPDVPEVPEVPAAATPEPPAEVDEYDEIYGRTMVRSVHSAAVHLVEDEADDGTVQPSSPAIPQPPLTPVAPIPPAAGAPAIQWPSAAAPAAGAAPGLIQGIPGAGAPTFGDHDGRTMTKAQIAAMRAAQAGAPAAAPVVSTMGGPTVPALLCPERHANPPQLVACRVCRVPLTGAPVPVARPVLGTLRFTDGTAVPLDRPALIGRNPKVEGGLAGEIPQLVKLDVGPGLSRTHASVRLEGWQVLLEDLNSANGTIVRLPGREPRRLHPGEPVLLEVGADVDLGGEISCVFDG